MLRSWYLMGEKRVPMRCRRVEAGGGVGGWRMVLVPPEASKTKNNKERNP